MEPLSCRQRKKKRYIQRTLRDFTPFCNIVKFFDVNHRRFRLQREKKPNLSLKTQKQTKLGVIDCLGLKTEQKSKDSHIEGC